MFAGRVVPPFNSMIEQDYGLVQQSCLVVWDLRLHSTTQWYCWMDFMFKQGPRQDRVFSHGFRLCFRIRWAIDTAMKLNKAACC